MLTAILAQLLECAQLANQDFIYLQITVLPVLQIVLYAQVLLNALLALLGIVLYHLAPVVSSAHLIAQLVTILMENVLHAALAIIQMLTVSV